MQDKNRPLASWVSFCDNHMSHPKPHCYLLPLIKFQLRWFPGHNTLLCYSLMSQWVRDIALQSFYVLRARNWFPIAMSDKTSDAEFYMKQFNTLMGPQYCNRNVPMLTKPLATKLRQFQWAMGSKHRILYVSVNYPSWVAISKSLFFSFHKSP